jgi:chaperone modulatory protein CbpM
VTTVGLVPRAGRIEVLARESGLPPDTVRRFVRLGLLDTNGEPAVASRLAQAARLRRDLGLGYGGAVLACRLLARIDELEARLRRYQE